MADEVGRNMDIENIREFYTMGKVNEKIACMGMLACTFGALTANADGATARNGMYGLKTQSSILVADTTARDTAKQNRVAQDSTAWYKELEGVTVVAKKPLVKTDIDKTTYDVESDPQAQSKTLLEMLRKVPMVTVDGQDNIMVNNSSSFKVYVNGKPNNMMSNNPSEVLKSMPANTIKKIEVITNPGPKYDAEGVGGILNIITMGSGMEGYTLTVGAVTNTNGAVGGNLFGTVQKGKLTVSGSYTYMYRKSPRSWSGSTREVLGDLADNTSANIKTESTSINKMNYQNGNLEASYEIDSLRLVSASFGIFGLGNRYDTDASTLGYHPTNGNTLYSYANHNDSRQSWYAIDGGIDYQRMFRTKGRMLTLSYKIHSRPSTTDTYVYYNNMEAQEGWNDYLSYLQNQYYKHDAATTEHTFQIDYTTPIGKLHTLETGVKYILRRNSSNDDRNISDVKASDAWTYDSDYSSHYRHTNNIFAAYAGYGLKWDRLSARLGLRYEHTLQDVKYLQGRGDDFKKNFDDIVPSASVGWRVSDEISLRLGYNMRIYRPGITFLNPYINDSDPTSISQGNTNLTSEKNHSFSFGFSLNTNKFSMNLNAKTMFVNNSIEQVTSLTDDRTIAGLKNPTGKSVLYSTYQNIGKIKTTGLSAYINWNIFSNTRIYTNLWGSYTDLSDGMQLRNNGWYGNTYTGLEQTLPKDWSIEVDFFGYTKGVTLQGKSGSYKEYGITIGKAFCNKRLKMTLYAGNIFSKYITETNTTESDTFRKSSWDKSTLRRLTFNISYRLGALKASVKKAERSIQNDDVK